MKAERQILGMGRGLTLIEAAKLLGIAPKTLKNRVWLKIGPMPKKKVGGRSFFDTNEVLQLAKKRLAKRTKRGSK